MNKDPKILCVIRSTTQYFYVRSVIDELVKAGCEVRVIFDKEMSETKLGEIGDFLNKKVLYCFYHSRATVKKKVLFYLRNLIAYRRFQKIEKQSNFYKKRAFVQLPPLLKVVVRASFLNILIKSRLSGRLLKLIDEKIPADIEIFKIIKDFKPDAVLSTPGNLGFYSADIEFIKAARQLSVKTVISTISWDNLTTKNPFFARPDLLLVWNKKQQRDAFLHHKIEKGETRIVGAPVFDYLFDKWNLKTKGDFCKKYRLDSNKPILLYLSTSTSLTGNERWLIEKLSSSFSYNLKLKDLQIVVRPHPFRQVIKDFKKTNITVIPKKGEWPYSKKAISLYLESILYSDMVFAINTSGMIDAVVVDRPVLTLYLDEYLEVQRETEHFGDLIRFKAIYAANTVDELISNIEFILDKEDSLSLARARFVQAMIRPLGLPITSGKNAASEIIKFAKLT